MFCRKCGTKIADNSKFCGFCGDTIKVVSDISLTDEELNVDKNDIKESILENYSANDSLDNNLEIVTSIEEEPIKIEKENNDENKISKLIWVYLSISFLLVVLVVVSLKVTKSSNNSLIVLEKAISNLIEKKENSFTIDANVSITPIDGENFSLAATLKSEKEITGLTEMQITINKSIMFDEMNLYAELNSENVMLYAESGLIDMLGMTSSETPTWVYYNLMLNEIVDNQTMQDIDFKEIIDEKHFVFVEKIGELNHYEMIIDQELVDKLKTKLGDSLSEQTDGLDDSVETLEKSFVVDFYTNELNELVKIELDMSGNLTIEDGMTSLIITFEFSNLANTIVEIPDAAKNSTIDLTTYFSTNAVQFGGTLEGNDYYYDNDFYY